MLAVIATLVVAMRAAPSAHDIPRSVTIHMFVKPEGTRLHVLVRVPLGAMRDIQFPQHDGALDIAASAPALSDAVVQWILPDLRFFEDGRPVAAPRIADVRVSLPSDRSFASFAEASTHFAAPPLADTVRLPVEQALLDARLEYSISSDRARLSVSPGFQRLGVDVVTAMRFVSADTTRAFELRGDPGVVRLDPSWYHASAQFVRLGFLHILDGVDHLLFLACLVIPLRRVRPLVLVVTAFTVAHSMTLIGSAMGLAPDALWFPPLVELLIAASILYMAIENVVATPSISRRCAMAFGFGLVHGFGFSFALKETLQFAGAHLVSSLFAFNVGVELGQLLVLATLVPAFRLLIAALPSERVATIVTSVLIGHVAWHWMVDRWATLRAFEAPPLDTTALLFLTRLALVLLTLSGIAWLLRRKARRRSAGGFDLPATLRDR